MQHKQNKILWTEFKETYLKFALKNKSSYTYHTYKTALRELEKFKTPQYLKEITPCFLENFQTHLKKRAMLNNGRPNAVSRNDYLSNIKIALMFAVRRKMVKNQSWEEVLPEKSQKFRTEYHSISILAEIKKKIKKEADLYTCFLLGTQEGLRRGEIAHLEKTDYIPSMHAIYIHPKKYWQPKTATSERYVPLQPESEAAIIQSIKRAPAASPYIINFYRLSKKRRSRTYVSLQYRRWLKKNFPDLKSFPHIWRHTFASQLLQHNAELKAVSELMGHSNISTTARYAHLEFDDRRRAASLMPKF